MQAVALSTKVDYFYFQSTNKDSIIHYTNIVKSFAKKTQQPQYYYFIWGKRLITHYIKHHQYNIALYEAEKMMKEAEAEKYVEGTANAYNVLSSIYISKKQYKQATINKEKEIELILKYDINKFNICVAYTVLVHIYCELKQLDKAYENINNAKKYIYNTMQELSLNCKIAKFYIVSKDYTKAWNYLQEAERIIETKKEAQLTIANYYEVMQEYYLAQHQYEKALNTQNHLSEILAKKNEYNLEYTFEYGKIYQGLGELPKAIQYYRNYIDSRDSLAVLQEDVTAGEFAAILGVERLNTEKSELQQQIQKRDLVNKQRIIIFLIIILILGVILFYREHLLNSKLRISQKMLSEKNQALLTSEEHLRHAKEIAENASCMKTEFIQNMSHEIRTPLNSIVGFSQILSSYFNENDETKEYANIIEKNSTTLLQLVNDVLDLSHLDSEHEIPACHQVDMNGICRSCINEIRPKLYPDVIASFEPERESFNMLTNPERVTQVLINLLSNAAKFTNQGKITLSYHFNEAEHTIKFTVTDTGCGIPEEKREFVFERFGKINSFIPGTGLGLPLSRMIAEKMGGTLTIDPNYSNGCRFVLVLPIQEQ